MGRVRKVIGERRSSGHERNKGYQSDTMIVFVIMLKRKLLIIIE